MAIRQGRCTNFGNCTNADRKQVIPVPDGSDFVCPECSRQLTEIGRTSSGTSPLVLLLGGLLLLLLLIALAGWWLIAGRAHGAPSSGSAPGSASDNVILRLSGSNTIGADLAPALAEGFLKQLGATNVRVVAGAGAEEKLVEATLPGDSKPSLIRIQAHGSATAFTALGDGSADIGMASRRIKPDEASRLASLGDLTSPASEFVLGLDGIAVIVNRSNPLTATTKDQLARIFSGETADWSAAGGRGGPIHLYARDDRSGTFDSFKSMVLGSGKLASTAQRFEDSAALSDAVANDRDAIGFIGLPYVRNAKALSVAERGAMAMVANRFTVATEDYPLSRRLYLYTPENPPNKYTRNFVQFALSRAGQDIVAANNFVAQNIAQQQQAVAPGAPAEYKRLTAGAQRLSLDFRFRVGHAELDNKAITDLDRVGTFIGDLHYSGENILLFGFADSTGQRQANQTLSEERARAVDAQLRQRGLQAGIVRGFGSELPVASNDTEEGREKNRRVEIWVKR